MLYKIMASESSAPVETETLSVDEWYAKGVKHEEGYELLRAEQCFQNAIKIQPDHAPSCEGLAKVALGLRQVVTAIENYAKAVSIDPDNIEYKRKFTHYAQLYEVAKPNDNLKQAVLLSMQTPGIDHFPLSRLWMSLLAVEPAFQPLFQVSESDDYDAFLKVFEEIEDRAFFTSEFFIKSLQYMVAYHRNFEHAFMNLRRLLLDDLTKDTPYFNADDATTIASALAQYCFFVEYILPETAEETNAIEGITKQATNGKANGQQLAVLGCYRPLGTIDGIDAKAFNTPALKTLKHVHIDEIEDLQKRAKNIPEMTPIENKVSQEVQAMYEHAPYPRWRGYSTEYKHDKYEGEDVAKDGEILVAGCGTGQDAIEMAAKYPSAQITAIDLSLSSLSYAVKKAEEFGIENITFGHGDILNLESLDKQFDFIISNGVLHHMEEPEKGLAVLNNMLKPGGTMRLALYSKVARKSVIRAQELIKQEGYGNDDASILKFRADIDDLMGTQDLAFILKIRDYYSLAECRDLLFHVQEHNLELREIGAMLKRQKLKFLGFYQPAPVLFKYKVRNLWDLKSRSLRGWTRFEHKNPETFAGMYIFWAQKKK